MASLMATLGGALALLIVAGCTNEHPNTDKPGFTGQTAQEGTSDTTPAPNPNAQQAAAAAQGQVIIPDDSNYAGGAALPVPTSPNGILSDGNTTAASGHDCRDDYPDYGWQRTTNNECSKVKGWLGPAGMVTEGFLPKMAFVTCKMNNVCYRFATIDNCNYEYWPPNKPGFLPSELTRDKANPYCRKDYQNYTFFRCYLPDGRQFIAQSTDGTSYQDASKRKGNIVNEVATNLPLTMGCPIKTPGGLPSTGID